MSRAVSVLMALLLAVATGCAAKNKKAATTPTAKADAKDKTDSTKGEEDKTAEETKKTSTEAPPEKKAEPPKPPTQELTKEKRDALVREQLDRGARAMKAHDADGMIRAALAALDVDETSVDAMVLLANGNYLKGYDDKTEAILNIAKKQRAGDAHPILWMLLGLVYDRTDREDQALAAYEKASQIKPDYLPALTNRGAIYLKRKRYADAIAVFEQVVQVNGSSPRAHTNLGSAYRGRSADLAAQAGQREQLLKRAETEFKTAMGQDASYAPAYFNMGILYLDADPFPGMDTIQRLQQAQKYLAEYKRTAGPKGVPIVDEYLAAAQKGIEREQKIMNAKRKRASEKTSSSGGGM